MRNAKFRADRLNRTGDMAVFRFLKMTAVRHLGFLADRNFNCRYGWERNTCVIMPNLRLIGPTIAEMAVFRFFKNWAFRHLAFFKN